MKVLKIYGFFLCLLSSSISQAQLSAEKAFPFALKDTLGYVHTLDDYKDKVLVIDFWFTGCVGCTQVARMLREEVKPAFESDSNVMFIAVSLDLSFLQWKRSIRTGRYTSIGQLNLFTNGLGSSHPIYGHYGFSGAPQLLIIDGRGYTRHQGVMWDADTLVTLINDARE